MKRIFSNTKERNDFLGENLVSEGGIASISIASPFLSETNLLNMLIRKNCNIRLIVRLGFAASLSALEKLLNAENACVRYFVDEQFHSKIYIVDNDFAVIGSSNFTNGGLRHNREINIQIPSTDEAFAVISDIFEEYWNCADTLTIERLEIFKNFINMHKEQHEKTESDLLDQLTQELSDKGSDFVENVRKKRVYKILTKRSPVSEELRKQRVRKALSKPVVCVDTGQRYQSLTVAARDFYNNPRSYYYISLVCKNERSQYKKHVWRFADDYDAMSDDEKRSIINELRKRFSSEELIIKDIVEKYLFRGHIFDSQSELAKHLISEGITKNRTSLAARSGISKKKGYPFFKVKSCEELIFFADYRQMYSGKELILEEPIGLSLEDLVKYYNSIFDIPIEDAKVVEILTSDKEYFFEMDGKYYKSEDYLRKNYSYDNLLSKKDVLHHINSNQYEFLWDTSYEDIFASQKQRYYQKNGYIFRNQTEYVDKFMKSLTKDELLIKLGIDNTI